MICLFGVAMLTIDVDSQSIATAAAILAERTLMMPHHS